MYSIEKMDYGFRIVLGGVVGVEEARKWLKEFRALVEEAGEPFNVFVDMRTLIPFSDEAQEPLQEGQRFARELGMIRSVVILRDNLTTLQLIRLARETGIYNTERYISSLDNPDWEQQGLDWLLEGKEPTG
ncbi:MAG: hypothetical protein KAV42_03830 [Candidatus Krumholzibacteria bacterium]|nr:hypothetical protein [Candidatus Krumholzibacteria bacterium]